MLSNSITLPVIFTARSLALDIPLLNNSGLITSDAEIQFHGNSLNNVGEINAAALDIRTHQVANLASGLLLSDGRFDLTADTLINQAAAWWAAPYR